MSFSSNMPATSHAPFIVIEGVDGSGKTTQASLLTDWLRGQGFSVILTREPGGTVLAERLRAILLDSSVALSTRAELLMMLAARAQHVAEVIAPALASGIIVVSDRFSLSSLAYQGYGRGLALDDICKADAVATAGITPTLTILLDVPLEAALARIGERQDRFEGEGREFLQRVIDGYRQLTATDGIIRRIDGTGTREEVQDALRCVVQSILPTGGHTP